jgi:hypothetical protein
VVVGAATLATATLVVLRALPVGARRRVAQPVPNAALGTANAS